MDVREKLVELLEPHMSGLACEYESGSCELTSCRSCNARNIADHLIAHGVTVQEWISVTERLPSIDETILVYDGDVDTCIFYKGAFQTFDENGYPFEISGVTHWMPLPEPPKEG